MGFLNSLYSGSAEFGRIQAVLSVVTVTLIGIVFIVLAFNLIFGKQTPPPPQPKSTTKPNQIKLSNRTVGIIMLLLALVIMSAAYFNAYAVFKIKAVAATEGVASGLGMIRREL